MSVVVHLAAPAAFGGLERVVSGLVVETARRGHTVILILTLATTDAVPPWAAEIGRAGVSVEIVRVGRNAYLGEFLKVRAILRRHRAEILHTHGYRSDVIGLLAAWRTRTKTVTTVHGFIRLDIKGRFYCWLQLRALRRFDAVAAVSRPLLEELVRSGVEQRRVHLIVNGFTPSPLPPLSRRTARAALDLPENGRVAVWVGRLSEEKGPDVLLDAFSRLSDRELLLCVIGDGPMLEASRARAGALGLSARVHFTGALAGADTYLAAFDLLVLSSRSEGTPMVLLEAIAAGLPIVATAVGGVPDLLATTGYTLVAPNDPAALARGIESSLLDPAEAARMAARAQRELAAAAAGGQWVSEYCALYDAPSRVLRTA